MKTTIWKFQLGLVDHQAVNMPAGAQILTCQMQGATPCIWALVNPIAPMKIRNLYVIGTGHPMPVRALDMVYLGTIQLHGGALIFHLFEDGR